MKYKDTILKGTFWVSLSTFFSAFAQLFRLAVLTRFLPKSDFGLVALLTLVLNLTYTFSDLGFSSALMHKKDVTRLEFSSLYWIQLVLYTCIYLCVISFSDVISGYFKEVRMAALLPLVLLDLILHGFGKLYETLLHKHYFYKVIAIRNICAATASLVVAIVLAIKGFGVYSLIYSTLCQSLLLNICNLVMGQKILRLQLYCSFKKAKNLIKIGIYQTGGQILDCLAGQLDVLIIGKAIGLEELGVYNLAKELYSKVKMIINSISNKVMLPIFSEIQDDNNYSRRIYLKMIKFLGIVNIPISSLIGLFSFVLIPLLYGKNYESDIFIFALMAIWAITESFGNPIGNIVTAKGKTNLFFIYSLVRLCVYIPGLFFVCKFGVVALVIGLIFFSYSSNLFACQLILKPVIGLGVREYQKAYLSLFVFSIMYMLFGHFSLVYLFGLDTISPILKYGSCFIVMSLYLFIYYKMEKAFICELLVKFDIQGLVKRIPIFNK